MNAHDLDFETIRPIDFNNEALEPGSKPTPFSSFLYAVVSGDIATAEAQITDDNISKSIKSVQNARSSGLRSKVLSGIHLLRLIHFLNCNAIFAKNCIVRAVSAGHDESVPQSLSTAFGVPSFKLHLLR